MMKRRATVKHDIDQALIQKHLPKNSTLKAIREIIYLLKKLSNSAVNFSGASRCGM